MKKEKKTNSVTFRIPPKVDRYLNILVNEMPVPNKSILLNKLIIDHFSAFLFKKAKIEGKDFAAKEFGLSDNIREAINKTTDIKGLFGSEAKEKEFLIMWDNKAKELLKKLWEFYEFSNAIDEPEIIELLGMAGKPLEYRKAIEKAEKHNDKRED